MKCQFCQQRCKLQADPKSTSQGFYMIWECPRHPVKVRHQVSVRRIRLRGSKGIQGTSRQWLDTILSWKYKNVQYEAHYYRLESDVPETFEVLTYNPGRRLYPYKIVFELKNHPKDITPENIEKKVSAYILFS